MAVARVLAAILLAAAPRPAAPAGGANEITGLVKDTWCDPQTCQPNAWLDFALQVDKQGTQANWLFEVEDLNEDVEGYKTDALSLHLFPHAIPLDRATGLVATQAKNRLYTLEVSYYDIKEDTYFVGVRCGPTPTTFRVLARSVVAPLEENGPREGEACDDQLIYHKFDAPANAAVGLVKVEASAKGADAAMFAMQHADTPPLRLSPPYTSVSPGESATMRVCWLVEGHAYYVALKTAAGCVPYTVTLTLTNDAEAVAACYDKGSKLAVAGGSHDIHHLPELEHNHFHYDVGLPLRYMDFRIHVGEADKDDNLVVFLEDLTSGPIDPRAFGLYLYTEGTIPVDRHTEHKSEFSVDGEYTVTINKWDLKKGEYVVSILTSDVSRSFRLVPYFIHSGIKPGGHVAGFVCPGQFVFHYIEVAGATDDAHRRAAAASPGTPAVAPTGPVDARFRFTVNTGDVNYLTRHLYPPLKLAPPYQHADSIDGYQNHTASICHAEPGRQYIGLSGGVHCAEYEMYADLIEPASPECTEITHLCKKDCDIACTEMEVHHFQYSSCTPGEYRDFMLTVAEEDAMSNLIFQVDNLSRDVRPEALGVYMFKDEIPANRESEDMQEFSSDGTWAVVVSEWDLKPAKYYLSVKCTGEEPVKFRVLAELSHSDLQNGMHVNGEVGPGSWAHYHYNVPTSATTPYRIGFQLQLFSGDVKLRYQADYPPIKLIPPYEVTEVAEHRGDGPYANSRMEVWTCSTAGHTVYLGILGGDHFSTFQVSVVAVPTTAGDCGDELHRRRGGGAAAGAAGAGMCPSDGHRRAAATPSAAPSTTPQSDSGPWWGRPGGAAAAPAVPVAPDAGHSGGGSSPTPSPYGGGSSPPASPFCPVASSDATPVEPQHFMKASCEPYEWVDFVLPHDESRHDCNVVIEVEDLDEGLSTDGLGLFVYKGPIPGDRVTEFKRTETYDRHYSVTINAYDFDAMTDYHMSVRCGSEPRSFRMLVEIVEGEVMEGTHAVGYVCPGDFVYHFFNAGGDGGHRRAGSPSPTSGGALTAGSGAQDGAHMDVKYEIVLHTGGVAYKTGHHHPPLKLVPPFRTTSAESTYVYLCDVVSGKHYLALTGLTSCADYELYVHTYEHKSDCKEPEHEIGVDVSKHIVEELWAEHFTYSSCEPYETKDFKMYVSYAQSKTNLVLDVTSLEDELNPDSLTVSLYENEIPVSRDSEFRRSFAPEGVWTLTKSYHDMHEGAYYLSVQCNSRATSFRVLPMLIQAQLTPVEQGGKSVHGEICPGDWVYHLVDVSDYIPGGKLHYDVKNLPLAFDIEIHSGDFYYMVRPTTPPIRLAPPYQFAKLNATEGVKTYRACQLDVEHYYNSKYYLALRGGDHCADYSVTATLASSCAAKFEHGKQTLEQTPVVPLREGHFMYASCEPLGVRAFSFVVPSDHPNNFVFDVEDVAAGVSRPKALHVVLSKEYDGVTNQVEEISESIGGIYRAAVDAVHVKPGATYQLDVTCQEEPVSFRVAVSELHKRLPVPDRMPGQLTPSRWVYHTIIAEDPESYDGYAADKPNMRLVFDVHVLDGSIFLAMVRENKPPGLTTLRSNHYHKNVDGSSHFKVIVCNPTKGTEYYMGLYGGEVLAEYELDTDVFFSAEPCEYPESDHGYVWRYFKDPPKSDTITLFFAGIGGILGTFLLIYAGIAWVYSSARMYEEKQKAILQQLPKNRKIDSVTSASSLPAAKQISPRDFGANKLKSQLRPDIHESIEAGEVELDGTEREHFSVISELDRRYGRGKGEHLFAYAKKMGIRRNRAAQELSERVERKRAYKGLFMYLWVTLLFITILQLQRSIPQMNELETSMKEYIERTTTEGVGGDDGVGFREIQTYEESFEWLENGFLERFFPAEEWYNGEALPDDQQGYLRLYNKKLSGFMIKQRRVRKNAGTCSESDRFAAFYPNCYPQLLLEGINLGDQAESKDPFGPPHETTKYKFEDFATGGGFAVTFPLDRAEAYATLAELKDDVFFDKSTRAIDLDITVYNQAFRLFTIVKVEMDVKATGRIFSGIRFYTFPIELYVTDVDYFRGFLELLFAMFVLSSLAFEAFEVVAITWDKHGFHLESSCYAYITSFENWIDMLRLLMWLVSLVWYLLIVNNAAAENLVLPLPEGQTRSGLQEVAVLWQRYAQLNAVSVLVCLCTVFRFLNLSPQYGTLVRTITRAAPSLIKFMMMFVLIFLFFAVMGQLMFGTKLEEWATVWSATQVLFQMMTGEYGFEPLLEADPLMAPLFYYAYLILVFFLLLNILLAILMDTYAIITDELESSEKREKQRHYHSVVKEIYWEFMLSVYHALGRAYNVAAYLTSERGLSMLLQEENKEMIARSYKLKLEDLDEDLEAVQDDDGLEDLIDYNLLCQYYSELSSVLLLLSIGDPLTKIHEESAAVMSADEAMEHNKANRNNSTSFVAEHALSLSGILGENRRESLLCEYGCVDESAGVLLSWCAQHVTYTFCNRTTYGPWQESVMRTEDGAINAYMRLVRELGGQGNDLCKASVRAWMCHEFFLACTADNRRVYKVCQSSCQTAYTLCGEPLWLRCDLEEEETLGRRESIYCDPPGSGENCMLHQHYAEDSGPDKYILGSGTMVFEPDVRKCTGLAPHTCALRAALIAAACITVRLRVWE